VPANVFDGRIGTMKVVPVIIDNVCVQGANKRVTKLDVHWCNRWTCMTKLDA